MAFLTGRRSCSSCAQQRAPAACEPRAHMCSRWPHTLRPPVAAASAVELKRQTATVDCPKSMVGRVIGKNGETIKALQTYTGALIQIDQTVEPTKVTISGTPHSLSLAVSMVTDIVKGTFKGFALLRQVTNAGVRPMAMPGGAPMAQPRPVYAPGYGLIPPSQVRHSRPADCSVHHFHGQQHWLYACTCTTVVFVESQSGRGPQSGSMQCQCTPLPAALTPPCHPQPYPAQLYGADERTSGVVAVGRQQAPMAWPGGGQMVQSQVIMVRALAARGHSSTRATAAASMLLGTIMGAFVLCTPLSHR